MRTSWPGSCNPPKTRDETETKGCRVSSPRLLSSAERFYQSISAWVAMLLSELQHCFLEATSTSSSGVCGSLSPFQISVKPHSCLVFTSSHRLLSAANPAETLNSYKHAVYIPIVSPTARWHLPHAPSPSARAEWRFQIMPRGEQSPSVL